MNRLAYKGERHHMVRCLECSWFYAPIEDVDFVDAAQEAQKHADETGHETVREYRSRHFYRKTKPEGYSLAEDLETQAMLLYEPLSFIRGYTNQDLRAAWGLEGQPWYKTKRIRDFLLRRGLLYRSLDGLLHKTDRSDT